MNQEPKLEWVSVSDRLPEPHKDVLLFFTRDDMVVASYYPTYKHLGRRVKEVWIIDNGDDVATTIDSNRPTHWMILPQPPK